MDIPRRNTGFSDHYHNTSHRERGSEDLLDLSEPFAWQLPPSSSSPEFLNHHDYRDLNDELTDNVNWAFGEAPTESLTLRTRPGARQITEDRLPSIMYQAVLEPHESASQTRPQSRSLQVDPTPSVSSSSGYMQRTSPFSLDSPVKEEQLDEAADSHCFEWLANTIATITYIADNGEAASITGLESELIVQQCPLLALALEPSKTGPKLHLEALTSSTANPFVLFLTAGSYAVDSPDGDVFENVPTSVLLHCQLFRLGVIYDLPGLKSQANVNIIRQCEFGCSSPDKPIELCAAIAYAYEHLREHTAVIDTIVSYCVSCFLRHRLGKDAEFRRLAYDLRPFHQDLCRNSMHRQFENETAIAIIQMPFKPYLPETYASREDINGRAYTDYVHHFHGTDEAEQSNKKRKRPAVCTLPIREAVPTRIGSRDESAETSAFASASAPPRSNDTEQASGCSKRRASSAAHSVATSDLSSEPEYELVAGPGPVEALDSDSDWDTTTLTNVERPTPMLHRQDSLPIRSRTTAANPVAPVSSEQSNAQDSGSESDWTVV